MCPGRQSALKGQLCPPSFSVCELSPFHGQPHFLSFPIAPSTSSCYSSSLWSPRKQDYFCPGSSFEVGPVHSGWPLKSQALRFLLWPLQILRELFRSHQPQPRPPVLPAWTCCLYPWAQGRGSLLSLQLLKEWLLFSGPVPTLFLPPPSAHPGLPCSPAHACMCMRARWRGLSLPVTATCIHAMWPLSLLRTCISPPSLGCQFIIPQASGRRVDACPLSGRWPSSE